MKMLTESTCKKSWANLSLCVGNTTETQVFKQLIKEHFELVEKIDTGELSDGYHTFNELYYHRAILFSVIINVYQNKSWKSKKHHDGTMFDGMFIVGIDTPRGQYSYHYDLNLWSLFNVKELEYAPEWDGHKPSDIDRLLSLNHDSVIQPYKFEDLKPKMWVWDDKFKDCIKIKMVFEPCELYPNGSFKSYHDLNEEELDFVEFEKGRFFPVTKSMYQGDMK